MKDARDRYSIDYAQIVRMTVMTPGPVNTFPVTPEIMAEVADSYDTKVLEAPIVLDHVERGPAYGHVLALELDDTGGSEAEMRLIADVGLLPDGIDLIKSGQYPERSVMFLNYYPLEGIWYLNHLALLGAANPAVVGLDPIEIADLSEDEMASRGLSEITRNAGRLCAERMHTWKKTERFFEYRIRPLSRFESLNEIEINKYNGIYGRAGKLKKKYVKAEDDPERIVNQALLFEITRWDMARAKRWMSRQQLSRETVWETDRLIAAFSTIDESVKVVMAEPEEMMTTREAIIAIWEETDDYIRHRVRDEADFRPDTMRTVPIDKDAGIISVMGKLKPDKVPEGGDADSMVVQNVMFDKSKDWTMAKAKQWVKDNPEFKGSQVDEPENTIAASDQSLTAVAEGGTSLMAESEKTETVTAASGAGTVEKVIVQAGSLPDLNEENAKLQARIKGMEAESAAQQQRLHAQLLENESKLRMGTLANRITSMLTCGYIIPAQVELGLVDALACIPAGAMVKGVSAEDIILKALEYGGAIKLKGEIIKTKMETRKQTDFDLDRLESSRAKVVGIDTARRARELRADGKTPEEAYALARAEGGED